MADRTSATGSSYQGKPPMAVTSLLLRPPGTCCSPRSSQTAFRFPPSCTGSSRMAGPTSVPGAARARRGTFGRGRREMRQARQQAKCRTGRRG
jgi:hypothetical protein